MSDQEQPQIYLITPPEIELSQFPGLLEEVLDSAPIACVRLALSSQDEDTLCRAADALREVTHTRDIALVIDEHVLLVDRLGLDGVHLGDGARRVAKTRKTLGADAIIGAYCGTSRHEGMSAGEAGADYVSFGPIGETALGDGARAAPDLFAWWSEMIEVPVVAEGALSDGDVKALSASTDFFGIGSEVWSAPNPQARLAEMMALFT